jgi:hypothetical protein
VLALVLLVGYWPRLLARPVLLVVPLLKPLLQ